MIACGVDVGARTVKAVLLEGGRVVGKAIRVAGLELERDIAATLAEALASAGRARDGLRIVATGAGREAVPDAAQRPTGITCAARGTHFLVPEARMLIDVGAEEGRAILTDGNGRALNFVVNEKCAAGAGTFIETMARTLEVRVEEFGPLALESTSLVPMNAQCAVFAESEVVSLIHAKTPKRDIARAVCEAMAGRIGSMCRRVAITPPVAMAGGMARNTGFVRALGNDLKSDLLIPPDPEFVSAVGAALLAAEGA